MSSRRKPWETPIQYTEDRFPEQASRRLDDEVGGAIKPDPDLVQSRVIEAQQGVTQTPDVQRKPRNPIPAGKIESGPASSGNPRPSWRDGVGNRSTDDTPLNYNRGPHDGELDVDDRDDPHYESGDEG